MATFFGHFISLVHSGVARYFRHVAMLQKMAAPLVGAPFCGAPVRPNMLNMPESAAGRFISDHCYKYSCLFEPSIFPESSIRLGCMYERLPSLLVFNIPHACHTSLSLCCRSSSTLLSVPVSYTHLTLPTNREV